jgi:hypothetical protein
MFLPIVTGSSVGAAAPKKELQRLRLHFGIGSLQMLPDIFPRSEFPIRKSNEAVSDRAGSLKLSGRFFVL